MAKTINYRVFVNYSNIRNANEWFGTEVVSGRVNLNKYLKSVMDHLDKNPGVTATFKISVTAQEPKS